MRKVLRSRMSMRWQDEEGLMKEEEYEMLLMVMRRMIMRLFEALESSVWLQ